jgi:hypothetical protein
MAHWPLRASADSALNLDGLARVAAAARFAKAA